MRSVVRVLLSVFLFLPLLVDLALGRLGDADGIRTGHRLLQPLLELPLRSVVRLLMGGRVFDVRIAATLLGRGMLHRILLLGEFSPITTLDRGFAFPDLLSGPKLAANWAVSCYRLGTV